MRNPAPSRRLGCPRCVWAMLSVWNARTQSSTHPSVCGCPNGSSLFAPQVSWAVPADDDPHVAPLTGFDVAWRRANGTAIINRVRVAGLGGSVEATKLAPGQSYEFAVAAVNNAGGRVRLYGRAVICSVPVRAGQ